MPEIPTKISFIIIKLVSKKYREILEIPLNDFNDQLNYYLESLYGFNIEIDSETGNAIAMTVTDEQKFTIFALEWL